MAMQRRILGHTGLEVSILGLGGFHLCEISAANAQAILNRYLDAGGNYVETAPEYGDGDSERKVGLVMATRRDECVLATKCHLRDRQAAARLFERSLGHLQTDHVDILFMHHVQRPAELDQILAPDGALRAAEAARDGGRARFIGLSNHGHPELIIEALKRYPFDVVMTTFNYYDRFNFPAHRRGVAAAAPGKEHRHCRHEGDWRWLPVAVGGAGLPLCLEPADPRHGGRHEHARLSGAGPGLG